MPVRNTRSKWYVSREAWPGDALPTWFQGLAYFISPKSAGLLFNTSLTISYSQVDDVFLGIVINKTGIAKDGVITTTTLSKFSVMNVDLETKLRFSWKHGPSFFFHVPNNTMYYLWALGDVNEVDSLTKIVPWFQW